MGAKSGDGNQMSRIMLYVYIYKVQFIALSKETINSKLSAYNLMSHSLP